METKTKQNGTVKRQNATVKKEVWKRLTNEAIGKTVVPEKVTVVTKLEVNLDDRIQKFEKLRGHFIVTNLKSLSKSTWQVTHCPFKCIGKMLWICISHFVCGLSH